MSALVYSIIVLIIIYQDSPLVFILGSSGYSLLPVISIVMMLERLYSKRFRIRLKGFDGGLFKLFGYLTLVSLISIIFWLLSGRGIIVLGENIVIKTLKGLLNFLGIVCFVYCMHDYSKSFTKKQITAPFYYVLIFMTVICIIESFLLPNAFNFLHFTGQIPYGRIRLLTKESSWTTLLIYIYSVLSLYYGLYVCKSKKIIATTIICFVVLLYYTSSKTLMLAVLLSVVVVFVLNIKKMSKKAIVLSVLLLILIFFAYSVLWSKLQDSISISMQYTSIPTRIYTTTIGLLIGVVYPFGTGTALYMYIFPDFLKRFLYVFNYFPEITERNLSEINYYINATSDEAVSVKSGFLQYNMYWGIVGTIAVIKMIVKYCIKPLGDNTDTLLIKMCVIISTLLTFISMGMTYEYFLLLIVSIHLSQEKHE